MLSRKQLDTTQLPSQETLLSAGEGGVKRERLIIEVHFVLTDAGTRTMPLLSSRLMLSQRGEVRLGKRAHLKAYGDETPAGFPLCFSHIFAAQAFGKILRFPGR